MENRVFAASFVFFLALFFSILASSAAANPQLGLWGYTKLSNGSVFTFASIYVYNSSGFFVGYASSNQLGYYNLTLNSSQYPGIYNVSAYGGAYVNRTPYVYVQNCKS